MTELQTLIEYYVNLLIVQYTGLTKATATITTNVTPILLPLPNVAYDQQFINFSPTPESGDFTLGYDTYLITPLAWDIDAPTLQTELQGVPGLSTITVTGDTLNGFIVNFIGVINPFLLDAPFNALEPNVTITFTDYPAGQPTLPLAVQNGYNLLENVASFPDQVFPYAVGVQLDVLGKYAGVVRSAITPIGYITLSDNDFLTFIKFAIVQNSAGSSLSDIEYNMNLFFPGLFLITDYADMNMGYLLSEALGTLDLFYVLIAENKIPKPMAVGLSVIVVPDVYDLFGFSTYFQGVNPLVKPFNTYDSFNTSWYFLSYNMAVLPLS